MKKYGIICLAMILLSSCTQTISKRGQDASRESWRTQIHSQPDSWTRNASSWFFTGKPQPTAPTRTWQLSACSRLVNYLRFPIHITHSAKNNCEITIAGQASVRGQIAARVQQQTLYLESVADNKENTGYAEIYVRMPALIKIEQHGAGNIEARAIHSADFSIKQTGEGDIYVSGDIYLTRITAKGPGQIVVLNGRSQQLHLFADGDSSIYLNGRLGLQNIISHGNSDITVIGAFGQNIQMTADETSSLKIQALNNQLDVHRVTANNNAQVLIDKLNSNELIANVTNYSYVGVSGKANVITVNTYHVARFAGLDLYAQDAFARAEGGSHINVRAANKIFAAARDQSTIYYFGDPSRLSAFTFNRGLVLPIDLANNAGHDSSFSVYRPYAYHKDSVEQTYYRKKGMHKIGDE